MIVNLLYIIIAKIFSNFVILSLVSNNIKSLRKKHHYTQEQFAQKLGIKRSLLGAYEEARAKPRLEVLVKAASLFNVSVDQLVAEDLSPSSAPPPAVEKAEEVRASSAKAEATAIKLVTKHEHASYFQNREDKQYLDTLAEIRLPVNPETDVYRAFEITDDAMYPVMPGTIVVGRRQENLQGVRDKYMYIVITRKEGILLRQVFNHIQEEGTLELCPANTTYEPLMLSVLGKEVEVWEAVYYISRQLPFNDTKPAKAAPLDLQQLTNLVLELQQEVEKLKEEPRK